MNFNVNFADISANATVIVPIVIAIVQAIKLTGFIREYFMPLLSIGIGIIVAFLGVDYENFNLGSTILNGTIYGLMASGLFSGIKTTIRANATLKEQRKKEKNGRIDDDLL